MLELWEGDLEPDLVATLEQPRGVPIPIGEAPVTVKVFKVGGSSTEPFIEAECEVLSDGVDGRPARVRHKWESGETDEHGIYFPEWLIAWDEDEPQTVPSRGVNRYRIKAR